MNVNSKMTDDRFDTVNEKEHSKWHIKIRYIQMLLLFLLLTISFCIRISLSVAIVAMTKNGTSINPDIVTYKWDNNNIILSSFFWSYAILQFFAGHLAHYFGTKWFLMISMFMNSISSILIPLFANYFGANGVMFCRIIQGLFQGFLLPLINNMFGRWVPINEVSTLSAIVYSGVPSGIIISMILTGYISASSYGWPYAFYLFGGLGLLWCIFWFIYSAESPSVHKTITDNERKFIEQSLGQENDHLIDTKSIPWKDILTSLPYWAIIIAAIGESWGSTLLNSELPNYLSNAVGLDIEDSSLYSAVPIAGSLIVSLCSGPIAGLTINRGYVTKVNSRRIFHGYGSIMNAIGLIWLAYLENKTAIAIVLIVTVSSSASVVCGHLVNFIDISPRFAGILAGISNGTGQLVAIFAPVLVHFVVTDETDKSMWRSMFILAAIIVAGTAIFFVLFCSSDRQWWDDINIRKPNDPVQEVYNGQTNKAFINDTHI